MDARPAAALFVAMVLWPLAPARAAAQDADTAPPVGEVHFNLARVKEQIESQSRNGMTVALRLEYQLTVFGELPEINPLEGFDTRNGPVPIGTPTHQDFQDLWTPQEFSAPVIQFAPLFRWKFGR